MPDVIPEVPLYMQPRLKPYGKQLWQATLKLLDGEALHPADYALLEAFCHTAEQLREMNDKVTKQPYMVVDGMVKANPLAWNAQSLMKSLTLLSDKLGINRVMRNEGGSDSVSPELRAFLRGDEHEVSS